MRVWLVDDRHEAEAGSMEALLRHLEARAESGVQIVGGSPFQPDFASAMRKLVPDLLDVLVINERIWPEGPWTDEVLSLGAAAVVVTSPERAGRFRPLAERHALAFVPPSVTAEGLWLALVAVDAARCRQLALQAELTRLQKRLNDRIVIERAKGVLVQRLGISEEDAYKRLRAQSRRQRRQLRDVAQALLDSQLLLSPDNVGCSGAAARGERRGESGPDGLFAADAAEPDEGREPAECNEYSG